MLFSLKVLFSAKTAELATPCACVRAFFALNSKFEIGMNDG